ncbi:SMI1/KNR4 family protein [Thermomonospora umbrina]|uniref:Cell wall assembly regulator SMI1 n=1 Tax=Thermomonospora umbrina TaxID=111806 RepID=A0A3D9SI09_9ACTN|nr:SMI1/KNR4 family protein [Thermomonospora umbrina]REE95532.1 cell wall assembly regulator SMI1 [Thermomonospora umbrina]
MASELDPPAEALLRSMAESVVAAAPDDWDSAILVCEAGDGGVSARLAYERPGGLDRGRSPGIDHSGLLDVSRRLGGPAGLDVELTVRPDGAYEAILTPRGAHGLIPAHDGHIYVLDPSYRPPQPGEDHEGPLAGTTGTGDPEEAARLLREVLRLKYEIVGRTEPPRPPASGDVIARLTPWAGVEPPADLLALYEVTDGDPLMFYGYEWLSLNDLMRDGAKGEHLRARERSWPGWETGWNDAVLDADPPGTVRRVTGHSGWIPFAHDGGGNYLAVDMAPAVRGRPGQVIRIGRDYRDGPGHLADSVTALLRMELDTLARGDYDAEEEGYIELAGREWDQTVALNAREHRIDARRATLNSVHGGVQRLIVSHGAELGLGGLHSAPSLHDLSLTCRRPDLSAVQALPLDNLTLSVEEADLGLLTGHPTLRTFTLETEHEVDVSPLGSLPLLNGLDLSKAVVADLRPLAYMGGLRFLVLSEAQWRDLREATDDLPPLAAAGLHGDVGHGAALKWADGFKGTEPHAMLRHTGRLTR